MAPSDRPVTRQRRPSGALRHRLARHVSIGLLLILLAGCGAPDDVDHPRAQAAPRASPMTVTSTEPRATPPAPVAVLSAPTISAPNPAPPTSAIPAGTARIHRADGAFRDLRIEIADTDATRARGLMQRTSLPADAGMLFIFPADTDAGFWMKDTLIPLSIAFVDVRGRIVALADMEPLSERLHRPGQPYRYALEVNQGYFAREGIRPGDVLEFRP